MPTTITSKGQVTIPKHIRDAVGFGPGSRVEFDVNQQGQVVLLPNKHGAAKKRDHFDEVLGTADIKWRTDELMALLRGDD